MERRGFLKVGSLFVGGLLVPKPIKYFFLNGNPFVRDSESGLYVSSPSASSMAVRFSALSGCSLPIFIDKNGEVSEWRQAE